MKRKYIIELLIFAIMSGIAVYWYYPKTCSLPYSSSSKEFGAYRGFGFFDEPGFFGKNFFQFTIFDTGLEDGFSFIECHGKEEYCKFQGVYTNGQKRMEGECWIEVFDSSVQLSPNTDKIKWGKYYKPDGSLASEVVDGTGRKTLWSIDGTLIWDVEIKDYRMDKYTLRDRQGKIINSKVVK